MKPAWILAILSVGMLYCAMCAVHASHQFTLRHVVADGNTS
jgi:hypothetical protein